MSIKKFSFAEAGQNSRDCVINEIFPGFGVGEVGLLYGPPSIGKTNLALSLCYELTLNIPFVGLAKTKGSSKRVLYVPFEDKEPNLNSKILEQIQPLLSKAQCRQFEDNFALYLDFDPLVGPLQSPNGLLPTVEKLAEAAANYDLLVLDTARSCLGSLDEVVGDRLLHRSLEYIAQQANVAVLLCHHLTKVQVSDSGEVNSTGGSGLSVTQSSSKFHLLVHEVQLKNSKKEKQLALQHTKANYLSPQQSYLSENPLFLNTSSTGLITDSNFNFEKYDVKEKVGYPEQNAREQIEKDALCRRAEIVKNLSNSNDLPVDHELLHNVESKNENMDHVENVFDEMFSTPYKD